MLSRDRDKIKHDIINGILKLRYEEFEDLPDDEQIQFYNDLISISREAIKEYSKSIEKIKER